MQDLEAFYDQYIDKVYKYFYINCLNRHIAEDLTSHTFVAFIEQMQQGRVDDHKKYLYAIMRNVWANHLRKKYQEVVESIEAIEDFEAHTEKAVYHFEAASLHQRASVYIDQLPEKQRRVAHMRMIEGMTIRQIAKEIGKNTAYVKTTQGRAIKSLKNLLEHPEQGGITA